MGEWGLQRDTNRGTDACLQRTAVLVEVAPSPAGSPSTICYLSPGQHLSSGLARGLSLSHQTSQRNKETIVPAHTLGRWSSFVLLSSYSTLLSSFVFLSHVVAVAVPLG